ncbi:hypothetical protein FA13DRAFT_1416450 [Coprinellus micaceus]|uniref:Nephrocystin 3-like N-terminal domain-containing protein n=1 Tax=Coprinellus micaceus TaxID=71717 RepID=A0A4Y7SN59_COPMI|nr:hypothetical protein FA13DRAFT_1416450 [Coprinellus micaceus]
MAQQMRPREATPIDAQTNEGPNFFANATNFTIGHQVNNNIQHTNITVNNIGSQDIQTLLNPLPDASHLRNPKRSPPDAACLPGTRLPLLKSIKSWVGSSALLPTTKDDPTRILWLYGYVGCGKSALAQTISETFYAKKRLAASFFFFRGAGDRSRSTRFACTMAAQLMDAHAVPGTRGAIESAARRPGILTDSPMPVQFVHLFLDPCKAALRKPSWAMAQQMVSGPFLAVVDGLDECEDRDEVRGWLERLVGFFKTNPKAPLRFLISSRAEDHIRSPLEDEEAKPFVAPP